MINKKEIRKKKMEVSALKLYIKSLADAVKQSTESIIVLVGTLDLLAYRLGLDRERDEK